MFNIKKQKCILALVVLSASAPAMSKEFSYDYVQATFSSITIDNDDGGDDLDGNGFSVSGSFSVAPAIALGASFTSTNYDEYQDVDIDTTSLQIGILAHTSVSPGTDVLGSFSVLKGNVEASDGNTTIDDDDTGFVVSVGLRHFASETLELEAGLSNTDIFDDSSTAISLGARLYVNEKLSLAAGYSTSDDANAFLLNARINLK